jgi:hypothetical protein
VHRRTSIALCLLGAVVGALALAAPASAAAKPHYTHGSDLKAESCQINENYPKSGVPTRTWTVTRTHDKSHPPVGVRYTFGAYAMVLDHTRSGDPHWGFVARSCLTNPYAYAGKQRLPDLTGVGGNGKPKAVPTSAAHAGKQRVATIHVGSVGTMRSAAQSFPIGNLRAGDPFQITRAHCGHHGGNAWILGYSPTAQRWGYLEAKHLPACL